MSPSEFDLPRPPNHIFQSIPASVVRTGNLETWRLWPAGAFDLATLLCVLEYTLLLLVSVVIPVSVVTSFLLIVVQVTGLAVSGAPGLFIVEYLPDLSHEIILYFVVSVGLLTALFNYFLDTGRRGLVYYC